MIGVADMCCVEHGGIVCELLSAVGVIHVSDLCNQRTAIGTVSINTQLIEAITLRNKNEPELRRAEVSAFREVFLLCLRSYIFSSFCV